MDFALNDDELALQAGIRNLCRGRFPIERLRAIDMPGGVERAAWRELGEAGVFALRMPEDDGGIGLGMTQAVIVFEELGRALVPGPLVASHLAAGAVEGAVGGERIVGLVERRPGLQLVEHLEALDALLALGPGSVERLDPAALDGKPVDRPLDALTPLHRVADLPAGERLDVDVARWRLEGAALTAAYLVGLAAATTERAVAYAKERRQFDKPIGSFQAVKHLCADMLVRTEVARAAVHAAGVMLDDPSADEVRRAVSAAKLLAGEAAVANGKTCVQVHGGMGFTWEVDAHLYLKRAVVHATHFGASDEHAEAMASHL